MQSARIQPRGSRPGPARSVPISVVCVLVLLFTLDLSAQVNSRAEEIQQARRQKAADTKTKVEEVSGTEKALNTIKDKKLLERFAAGIAGFRL